MITKLQIFISPLVFFKIQLLWFLSFFTLWCFHPFTPCKWSTIRPDDIFWYTIMVIDLSGFYLTTFNCQCITLLWVPMHYFPLSANGKLHFECQFTTSLWVPVHNFTLSANGQLHFECQCTTSHWLPMENFTLSASS